jgi:VIT1/CCC1 family predicted Fe2+/Mn2+ transporter
MPFPVVAVAGVVSGILSIFGSSKQKKAQEAAAKAAKAQAAAEQARKAAAVIQEKAAKAKLLQTGLIIAAGGIGAFFLLKR